MFYPILGFPLGTWVIIIGVFELGEETRKLLVKMKKILRRVSVRVAFEGLNFLYLPIISSVIDLLFPTRETCSVGEYMQYTYDPNSTWAMFVNRSYVCTVCGNLTELDSLCGSQCVPNDVWRLRISPGLLFKEDVVFQIGPLILYAFGAAIVGVPILTLLMASQNRDLISQVIIFGNNIQEKWDNLLEKIRSTGVYIFEDYEYEFWYWGVVDQIAKVGISIITIFKDKLSDYVIYGLPIIFLFLSFFVWIKGPYRMRFNNILEGWCYFLLGCFCIIPIISAHGMVISEKDMVVSMVGFLLAPFVSLVGCFGYKGKILGRNDITWDIDDFVKVIKPLEIEQVRLEDDDGNVQYKLICKEFSTVEEEMALQKACETVEINFAQIRCIAREEEMVKWKAKYVVPYEDDLEDRSIEYRPFFGILAVESRKIYKQVDRAIDIATTDLVARALSIGVIIGCGGFGFFLGSLLMTPHEVGVDCSGELF
jgi:hypothetical protein